MASPQFMSSPDFDNLMHPENIRNPFPLYTFLREKSPVHWCKPMRGWLLTRFSDVRAALGNTQSFSSRCGIPVLARADALTPEARRDFDVGYRFFYEQIQTFDDPAHAQQRSLITKAFSARVIEGLRELVQKRVDALIDGMEAGQSLDFVRDFAYPLPSLVIFDLLGVTADYYETLRRSAEAFTQFPAATLRADAAALHEIAEALGDTDAALRRLLMQRRREPGQDLISALAAVEQENATLSDDEIVVLCNFLLFAGHETTANLLAGSVAKLLEERILWDRLRSAPERVPGVIDELLRFVSPVLTTTRLMTEDVELHGTVIRKGDRVSLMIGAANHDPAEYEQADHLVLERSRVQSLAFGYGPHYCVGAMLARMETDLALRTLMTRLPQLRLVPAELTYQPVFFLRALKSLPVAVS